MEGEEKGFKKVNGYYLIGFIVLGIVIVVSLLVTVLTSRQRGSGSAGSSAEVEKDDGATEEQQIEGASYVTFENDYQLWYLLGKATTLRLIPNVGGMIIEITDKKDGGDVNLVGTIIESTVNKDDVDSGFSAYFEVDVSNGEKYQAWMRTGALYNNAYDALLVRKINPESNTAYLKIGIEPIQLDLANRDLTVKGLSDWAMARLPNAEIVMNVVDSRL